MDRDEKNKALHVGTYPGVRTIELRDHDAGNYFTKDMMKSFSGFLHGMKDNWIVNYIFIASSDVRLTSCGLKELDAESVEALNKLSTDVHEFPKAVLGVFAGHVCGSVAGLLLNSKYRLGTPSLRLVVDELQRGQIPMAGFHGLFSKLCPQGGSIMSRYLACTGACIEATDLYELGLLTNLTCQQPYHAIGTAMALSLPDNEQIAAYQTSPCTVDGFDDMLDAIDMNCDLPSDLMDGELWNKYMMVETPALREKDVHPHNIQLIYKEVQDCFSLKNVEDVVHELGRLNKGWTREALYNMSKVDPLVLKVWYEFTNLAENKTLLEQKELEVIVNKNLSKLDISRQPVDVAAILKGPAYDPDDLYAATIITYPDVDTAELIHRLKQVSIDVVKEIMKE